MALQGWVFHVWNGGDIKLNTTHYLIFNMWDFRNGLWLVHDVGFVLVRWYPRYVGITVDDWLANWSGKEVRQSQ